jgi:ADP-dependent phosphofructokinase/glucokinase
VSSILVPIEWKSELVSSQPHEIIWNIDSLVFFQIPGQLYRPSVEVAKSCLRPIIKGYQRNSSPQYYISFTEGNEEEEEDLKPAESRLIVQMDTESPIIYQKTTLDYYFDKPIRVSCKDQIFNI